MGAIWRGLRNPFRNRVRTAVVVVLLAMVVGLFALMVQATLLSRQQLGHLEARVRTLIELREAGAFGTGGFGGDKPVGEEDFSLHTLEKIRRIPSAGRLVRIDEYVYAPQIDPTRENAYAMIIGTPPGAAMRAFGEVDYENARVMAGRGLREADVARDVAVVGRLYATQRLGLAELTESALSGTQVSLNGRDFQVIGVYTTENDFGDNHVFIPLEAFRRTYHPGKKLSKIFVTVDSIANVERVVADLKASIAEADVVTTPEAVSTAKTTLGGIAATSAYGSILLFAVGGILVSLTMVLTTKERLMEVGTLKAIGASNGEIAIQFLAEVFALTLMAGGGALLVAALARPVLQRSLGLAVALDGAVFLLVVLGCFLFAAIGSLYPILTGMRLRPVEAMRKT